MRELYDGRKREDGFLYVLYSAEEIVPLMAEEQKRRADHRWNITKEEPIGNTGEASTSVLPRFGRPPFTLSPPPNYPAPPIPRVAQQGVWRRVHEGPPTPPPSQPPTRPSSPAPPAKAEPPVPAQPVILMAAHPKVHPAPARKTLEEGQKLWANYKPIIGGYACHARAFNVFGSEAPASASQPSGLAGGKLAGAVGSLRDADVPAAPWSPPVEFEESFQDNRYVRRRVSREPQVPHTTTITPGDSGRWRGQFTWWDTWRPWSQSSE